MIFDFSLLDWPLPVFMEKKKKGKQENENILRLTQHFFNEIFSARGTNKKQMSFHGAHIKTEPHFKFRLIIMIIISLHEPWQNLLTNEHHLMNFRMKLDDG